MVMDVDRKLSWGVFGGTFNPFHNGHLSSILQVAKAANLEKVVVVPSNQNPNKAPIEGPTAEQRLEIVRLGTRQHEDLIEVSELEISRGGKSYTWDTILQLKKSLSANVDLALIVGLDVFYGFDQWHEAGKILSSVNLIVTSRPGFSFPTSIEELPVRIREQVDEFNFEELQLKNGRRLRFVRIEDVEVSATEIRRRARAGYSLAKFVSPQVEDYISSHKVYGTLQKKIDNFEKFTRFCGQILFDKKGIQVRGFDLQGTNGFTDFSLIASGSSTRHAASLGESVMKAVKDEYGVYPLSLEGLSEGRWVLLDYGALVVHIFYDYVRQEYRLEELWKAGADMSLVDRGAP